ncbi:MAG: DNA-processing protein DprA, partial [Candidatus Saganbacteria bacterium]|nr:DNA-processing protein DprA [Candidatus Saganbacteria bacterium]
RDEIPRFVRVMENLATTHLTEERKRILFHDKFSEPNEPEKREYSVCDLEPPKIIYARGLPPLYKSLSSKPYVKGGPLHLAIVGPIGPRVNANVFAERLAEIAVSRGGATIISGFAEGIDKHAHLGALNASGKTIGFLPHGIVNKQFYTETTLLKYLIPIFGGGFVSEYYETRLEGKILYMKNKRSRQEYCGNVNKLFLLRDGRTTALSDAVVVVEAAKASGSVDTGRRAYLQGIPVFVVDWRMVDLQYTKDLPDVINGGLKQLAIEGCAIPFPPRERGKKIPLNELPKLFLDFILTQIKHSPHYR